MKKIIALILIIPLIALGVFVYFQNRSMDEQKPQPAPGEQTITSYDECVEAGYPVMESYPPRCSVPGRETFTQDIGNEQEYHDEIQISNPRPNSEISNPLTISGQARGTWYFEGSFSAELFDANRTSLSIAVIQAQDEWMTEEFVSFSGTLEFTNPQSDTGFLVIKNANPSGLPENHKEVIIPVQFK